MIVSDYSNFFDMELMKRWYFIWIK
jgi:hypothetical protein